jgi:hypothetical protein
MPPPRFTPPTVFMFCGFVAFHNGFI